MPMIAERVTNKELARTQCITCSACNTKQRYVIVRTRVWLTWLGIPYFHSATTYAYSCPACGNSHPLVKQQARAMAKRAKRYA